MFLIRSIFLLTFLSITATGLAQVVDSTIVLKPALSELTRERFYLFDASEIDSSDIIFNPSLDVIELISRRSTATALTYGAPGTVSSLRPGGLAPDHVTVSWNGLDVNSLSLGSADLSLFPAFLFPRASYSVYESGTASPGNSIAASLDLTNSFVDPTLSRFGGFVSYNTLHNRTLGLSFSGQLSRLTCETRILNQRFLNQFNYTDYYKPESPLIDQHHNNVDQYALSQFFGLNTGSGSSLFADIFYQFKTTRVPEIMGSYGSSSALQTDSLIRIAAGWKRAGEKNFTQVRGGGTSEWFRYQDEMHEDIGYLIDSRLHSRRAYIDVNTRLYLDHLILEAGGQFSYNSISTSNYSSGSQDLQRHFVFTSSTYKVRRIEVGASVKMNVQNGSTAPDASAWVKLTENTQTNSVLFVTGRAQVQRKNRFADFNERFWNPGGSPDLLPEESDQIVGDVMLNYLKSRIKMSVKGFARGSAVRNWIQWIPSDEGYFKAVNYREAELLSFGGDLRAAFNSTAIQVTAGAGYEYQWNRVRNGDHWERLTYSPEHIGYGFLGVSRASFFLKGSLRLCSERNTSQSDLNPGTLEPYTLVGMNLGYSFRMGDSRIVTSIAADNLLNQQVQFIRSYPTPGRVFTINLVWDIAFTKSNSNK